MHLALSAVFLAAIAPAGPPAPPLPIYERPPILFSAADLLPAEQMSGARHGVIGLVENDGFMNHWRIKSDWGELAADSDRMLRVRLREVDALIRLEDVERSEAFLDAFEAAITGTWRAARQVVEQPVETAKGLPGGVARMFRRTSRRARDFAAEAKEEAQELREDVDEWRAEREPPEDEPGAGDTAEEAAPDQGREEDGSRAERRRENLDEAKQVAGDVYKEARRYFQRKTGYRRARRSWARSLGVDPYGDNEALNRELFRVAVASAAGGFSLQLVPVPTIPGLTELRDVKEVVYDLDALDLRLRNEKLFKELGFDRSFTDALYDGHAWSDSLITELADAMTVLDNVANVSALIAWARDAATRDEARFQATVATYYATLHRSGSPLSRLHEGDAFVSAVLTGGPVVVALAVDRLGWTEEWEEIWIGARDQLRLEEGKPLELHLAGDISALARRRLEQEGVRVVATAF